VTLYVPLWAQNTRYPAAIDRLLFTSTFDGGVFAETDLKVGPRGAGTNMSIDISAGRVVIPGPSGNYVCVSDAVENRTVGAAPPVNTSRVDLVVATVTDNQATGVGAPAVPATWDIVVVAGTPAASSPQTPALPANSVALARLVMAASDASVAAANVHEARPCAVRGARGLLGTITTTADWTVGSSTFAAVAGSTISVVVLGHRWIETTFGGTVQGNAAGALCDGASQINGTGVPGAHIANRAQVAGGPGMASKWASGVAVLDPGTYSFRLASRMLAGGQSTFPAGMVLLVYDRGAAPTSKPPFVPSP